MFDAKLLSRLTGLVGDFPPGTVALVGAGPGDSALICVRGAVRLAQADAVLHDELVGPELLELARAEAERVLVGKWRGEHTWTQEQINAALVRHARAGQRVVRLKGGDPFVFGRGGEECQYLAEAGVPFEVVPGITAAFGVPVSAGIPVTHGGLSRSFALVSGHAEPDDPEQIDFEALARMETVAFYAGLKNLAANCERLVEAGADVRTPAAVIQWGTSPRQRTVVGTIGDIADRVADEDIEPPALVLIGQVVRLRDSIEWFERRPLHGQTVVVTRSADQAGNLAGPLRAAGAEVIEAPTIEIVEIDDPGPIDDALADMTRYDWLVLTSANGVDAMFARLEAMGADARSLAGPQIAAVGSATAARLGEHGIRADLVPPEAVGEALADALIRQGIAHKRVLLLRADVASSTLPDALRGAGAECEDVPAYRTIAPKSVPADFVERVDRGEIDWITFTSPSSFDNLLSLLGEDRVDKLRGVGLASIGPVSTRAIRDAGFTEAVEADPHDARGLVDAIIRAAKRD